MKLSPSSPLIEEIRTHSDDYCRALLAILPLLDLTQDMAVGQLVLEQIKNVQVLQKHLEMPPDAAQEPTFRDHVLARRSTFLTGGLE